MGRLPADFDYQDLSDFHIIQPDPAPLSEDDAAETDRLRAELDSLEEAGEEDSWERQNEIEQRLAELESGDGVYTDAHRQIGGVIVYVGCDGEAEVMRGLVRGEDAPQDTLAPASKTAKDPAGLSAALVESLTAHKTAILAAELMHSPDIGLAAVVHALALRIFAFDQASRYAAQTSLEVNATMPPLKLAEGSKAHIALINAQAKWAEALPANAADLWAWCLEQSRDRLLELLAFLAARCVNAVQAKQDRPTCSRLAHAGGLSAALQVDMRDWFAPTAGNFFSRISRTGILSALAEAKGTQPRKSWSSLKKAELAALAERGLAATRWLPAPLRT